MTLPKMLHKKDQPAAALAMPQKPFRERLVNDLKSNWILYLMALPALTSGITDGSFSSLPISIIRPISS